MRTAKGKGHYLESLPKSSSRRFAPSAAKKQPIIYQRGEIRHKSIPQNTTRIPRCLTRYYNRNAKALATMSTCYRFTTLSH